MPDEDLINDNEPVEQPVVEKPARSDNRIQDLANKVKDTAAERDAANLAKEEAEKELNFYKGFSRISSKPEYQAASEYQDKIKEKVLSGYDMEDAAISVLGKAGKLGNFTAPAQRESPTGGSATTNMNQGGDKTIAEMTRAEKREALLQGEAESGSLTKILRSGL